MRTNISIYIFMIVKRERERDLMMHYCYVIRVSFACYVRWRGVVSKLFSFFAVCVYVCECVFETVDVCSI